MPINPSYLGVDMKLCFVISHSPYNSSLSRDALDMALASAAFDQDVILIFIGDGIFQLTENQQTDNLGLKNIQKSLAALELYDIKACYVCERSAKERNINKLSTKVSYQLVSSDGLREIINNADKVMSF